MAHNVKAAMRRVVVSYRRLLYEVITEREHGGTMQIHDEYRKWVNGKTEYTANQVAVLELYERLLGEVADIKILTVVDKLEDLLNMV